VLLKNVGYSASHSGEQGYTKQVFALEWISHLTFCTCTMIRWLA